MLFWKGWILGLSIAAPVGPIGLLCIRRSLAGGMREGLLSGLGAATADLIYGLLAAFGLAGFVSRIVGGASWIEIGGAVFLLWLAIGILRSGPPREETTPSVRGRAFFTTFALTLTNPMTILAFTGLFAGAGLARAGEGAMDCVQIAGGVFFGSACWWLCLSSLSSWMGRRMPPSALLWVQRMSGVVILAFALRTLYGHL